VCACVCMCVCVCVCAVCCVLCAAAVLSMMIYAVAGGGHRQLVQWHSPPHHPGLSPISLALALALAAAAAGCGSGVVDRTAAILSFSDEVAAAGPANPATAAEEAVARLEKISFCSFR